jgi:hypothetical protein
VRNAVALDRFVPISTGGGQVLFAGTYLPSDGDPEKVGAEVVAENPDLFQGKDTQRLRLEQILVRLAADRYPGMETDQALSKLGKEQLWDDISGEPADYAGFVAAKVWRIWSHGPRDVMREPVWEVLHWLLVAFGLAGLAETLGGTADRHDLPRDHPGQRPARRLTAARPRPRPTPRRPGERRHRAIGEFVRQ